jgi:hypothetical protein
MSKIKISEAKKIREQLDFTHLVIFGIDKDNGQHVVTHGKTVLQANEAANFGNNLKELLSWPDHLCNTKPIERICENCSYFQRSHHHSCDVIQSNMHGKCMFNPEPVKRYEQDRACGNFEPAN